MNKVDVLVKIREMIRDDEDWLVKEAKRLLDSGAVDVESYPNNFSLPKILYAVSLKNLMSQRQPLYPDHKKEMRNLEKF